MKQIVCLSTSPWYPIPTRKQQVMSRIPDAEILYFDPPVSLLAPLKDPAAKEKLKAYRQPGVQPQPNITVYAVPPVLPFFNKFRFLNRWNQRRQARYIQKRMAQHGFQKPLVWCYSPCAADAAPRLSKSALVYDCVDKHSAYGGLMDPQVVDTMELDLARQADQVFATATGLAERLHAANDTAVCIPNGANYERFAQAAQPQPVPADMADIPGPIFGFVGALQDCIAYDLVVAAAKARPQWSFVFIGGEKPGVDLSPLKALDNIHFLGLKKNEDLPAYLHQFDVCLNLFVKNDLSKDVSPLKFYEYLATGKPIVSTPQPDQVLDFRDLIHLGGTAEEFLAACEAALADTDPARQAARMAAGKDCSWDARVAQMGEVLTRRGVW
jgi:glycosyltransferase involved in cell wall biosynthesis